MLEFRLQAVNGLKPERRRTLQYLLDNALLMKRCHVIINKAAGGASQTFSDGREDHVQELLRADGLQGDVYWEDPATIRRRILAVREEDGNSLLIVGGGDGTLNTAANLLAGTSSILGVLPLGTFNHFAKDVGIPLTSEQAIRTIAQGTVRRLDLGRVNDQLFLNNVSIGVYPHAVTKREMYRRQLGVRKSVAMGYALLRVFRRPPLLQMRLRGTEAHEMIQAPFLFIGNNRYEKQPFSLVRRESLDSGHLSVFYTRRMARGALLKLALQILFRRLQNTPELTHLWLKEFTIECRKPFIKLALDGEVTHELSPLAFRSQSQCLQVITPRNASNK